MSVRDEIIWQDKLNNRVNTLTGVFVDFEEEILTVKNKLSDCQAKLTSCNGKLTSCENENQSMGWVFVGTVLILIGLLYTYNSIILLNEEDRNIGEIILYWFIFVALVILLIIGVLLLIPLITKLVRSYHQ